VTPKQIHYLDANGEVERIESNVRMVMDFGLPPEQEQDLWDHGIAARPGMAERRVAPSKDDDAHVERWIKHRGLDGYIAKEARAVWALFRTITEGKALRDCDRDDGRKLAAHLFESGNKSGTVKKKVGHLCAAVNLAIDEGKLKFNPFANVVEQRKDASVRWPMSCNDMALVRKNLDLLGAEERLLWMLCATTGMRRGEACSIDREYAEKGIRYVIVGSKTDASLRRIPLPSAVLPLLPAEITGPLFKNTARNVGRNLLRAIRRFGVTGKLKDIHALRHRAKDRLRAEDCPSDMQDWILGHDEMTVSVDYGEGPSVSKLRPWVEKIGY
jgi:integrase